MPSLTILRSKDSAPPRLKKRFLQEVGKDGISHKKTLTRQSAGSGLMAMSDLQRYRCLFTQVVDDPFAQIPHVGCDSRFTHGRVGGVAWFCRQGCRVKS